MRRAGAPSIYIELPYTEHAFDLFVAEWAPAYHAATYDTERVLAILAS